MSGNLNKTENLTKLAKNLKNLMLKELDEICPQDVLPSDKRPTFLNAVKYFEEEFLNAIHQIKKEVGDLSLNEQAFNKFNIFKENINSYEIAFVIKTLKKLQKMLDDIDGSKKIGKSPQKAFTLIIKKQVDTTKFQINREQKNPKIKSYIDKLNSDIITQRLFPQIDVVSQEYFPKTNFKKYDEIKNDVNNILKSLEVAQKVSYNVEDLISQVYQKNFENITVGDLNNKKFIDKIVVHKENNPNISLFLNEIERLQSVVQ